MEQITEREIRNNRRVRKAFESSPTELLKEDLELNTFPEYEHIIKNIIKERKQNQK